MGHILYRGGNGRDEAGSEQAGLGADETWREFMPRPSRAPAQSYGQRYDESYDENLFAEDALFEPAPSRPQMQARQPLRLEDAAPLERPEPKGRVKYAPTQHPAVHESLMQAVREENPAVQHFIDLQRAAAQRAAEIKAREEARKQAEAARHEAERLARARAAEEAHLQRYGFVPEQGQPLTSAQLAQIQLREAQEALAHAHQTAQAQAKGEAPRERLADYLPAAGLATMAARGMKLASVGLALVIGLWSADQMARSAAGLPTIKAPEGPAREAPLDPGGELARHTGLAVNSVAALGIATRGPDRILLAPAVAELDPEDAPMAALAPLPAQALSAQALSAQALSAQAAPQAPTSKLYRAAVPVPDTQRGLPASAAFGTPQDITGNLRDESAEPFVAPLVEEDGMAEDTIPSAPLATVDPDAPGLKTSPRPRPRPASAVDNLASVASMPAPVPASVLAADTAEEIAPEALKAGTRLAQLGAFDSADLARAEWLRVAQKFGPLMEGKRRVIQEAVSGGRSFYRLRVEGFADVASARQFCAALVAEQTNCTPAQVR